MYFLASRFFLLVELKNRNPFKKEHKCNTILCVINNATTKGWVQGAGCVFEDVDILYLFKSLLIFLHCMPSNHIHILQYMRNILILFLFHPSRLFFCHYLHNGYTLCYHQKLAFSIFIIILFY